VAHALWHRHLGKPRVSAEAAGTWVPRASRSPGAASQAYADAMQGALLGPSYSDDDIASWLASNRVTGERVDRETLPARIAALIVAGNVVGLFQGRMEFGPRALGCRSIIADARSSSMQSVLNLKIKFRESFRPFAPAVLRDHVADWFEFDDDSPYMLMVADVAPSRRVPPPAGADVLWGIDRLRVARSTIPAVTHVDDSARIQTVRRTDNPLYFDIIKAFYDLTGCPVIVNTSFNVKDEPIVCTPDDAYKCFMKTGMDVLAMESFLLAK
jgi:carbamoyltransferase